MNLDNIYEKIQNNGIKVMRFGLENIKSVSVETNNRYGIFINYKEIKNSNEEFLVITHEYGHCMTGSTHPLYSSFDTVARHEYRADRKAICDFLPFEKIRDAIQNGCRSLYELAEFLDVPEEFISTALQHYNAMELI